MLSWIKNLNNLNFSSGEFSESYQDILLDYIFSNIRTTNSPPFCVEFGYYSNSILNETANTSSLILKKGWDSLLLDSENHNPKINLKKHFLTTENILEIFEKYQVPLEPEYISIDIDSTDLWIFETLVKKYRAKIFSVEYNCNFPITSAITIKNDPLIKTNNDRAFGASLKALNIVAEANNYLLLWVVEECDAFFIRKDLIDDNSDLISFPLEKWEYTTNIPAQSPIRNKQKLESFLDYEVFLRTNGDISQSTKAAREICEKVLLLNFPRELKRVKRLKGKWRRNKKRLLKKIFYKLFIIYQRLKF